MELVNLFGSLVELVAVIGQLGLGSGTPLLGLFQILLDLGLTVGKSAAHVGLFDGPHQDADQHGKIQHAPAEVLHLGAAVSVCSSAAARRTTY